MAVAYAGHTLIVNRWRRRVPTPAGCRRRVLARTGRAAIGRHGRVNGQYERLSEPVYALHYKTEFRRGDATVTTWHSSLAIAAVRRTRGGVPTAVVSAAGMREWRTARDPMARRS